MKELVQESFTQIDLNQAIKKSGKEKLDLERIKDLMTSLGKTEEERRVLTRIKNNPSFIQQIMKEYYVNTPSEVRTTDDFINWVNNWELRRGNL